MALINSFLAWMNRDEEGQGLVEYGIMIGLSILLIAILLVFFDDQLAAVLHWLTNQLP